MGYESTDTKIDIELNIVECTICFVNEQNKVLSCEHKVCEDCYENIDSCPFCRNKIDKPISNTDTPIDSPIDSPIDTTIHTRRTNIYTNTIQIEESANRRFYIFMSIVSAGPIGVLFYAMTMFNRPR